MKLFLSSPHLMRMPEEFRNIAYDIHGIPKVAKVSEFKELMESLPCGDSLFILTDNRKLAKWLTKQKNPIAGMFYEPRDKLKEYFSPKAVISVCPSALQGYGDIDVYREDWRAIYEAVTNTSNKPSISYTKKSLNELLSMETLACDIETTGLSYYNDKILTIGFAWYDERYHCTAFTWDEVHKPSLIAWLKSAQYKIFHNSTFDLTFLCRDLGIEPHDLRRIVDTKLLAYCENNSSKGADNSLGFLARHLLGDWKINFDNVSMTELLKYNAKDCAATYWLYDKYIDTLTDFGIKLHKLIPQIIRYQLQGWFLNKDKVLETKSLLTKFRDTQLLTMSKLRPSLNPASSKQLQALLFGEWKFEPSGTTPSGGYETGKDAINYCMNQTSDEDKLVFLKALLAYKEVDKIIGTFLTAMEEAVLGDCYMRGSYNIGGTKSGRLSSSSPNLQNLPSSVSYAKDIKACFTPPKGWVIVSADYSALEDRVSALTTRDPNKLRPYTEGIDAHCMNACAYFNIPNDGSVESINSIKKTHPKLRTKSKAPTFALTYAGSYTTLVRQCGFTMEQAKQVETNFQTLYAHSRKWVEDRLEKGIIDGYIELAFGHRIKTPLLQNCVTRGTSSHHLVQAEKRTAGNALGQSYCMVNSFTALNIFNQIKQLNLINDIKPIGEIHDAQYYLVRNDPVLVSKACELLEKFMPIHDCPELDHPTVKLEAEAEIYVESWAKPITLKEYLNAYT